MPLNSVNRELPEYIEGYGKVKPYGGVFTNCTDGVRTAAKYHSVKPGESKLMPSLDAALDNLPLFDGMTVSFHHHLRNGDKVLNLVMAALNSRGIKDIRISCSGIFPCHEPLVDLIKSGVVTKIMTNVFNPGPVPKAITAGYMKYPAVLRSHGGRPRAIESGEEHIDIAFIAAPSADEYGNLNGVIGPSACGVLSYAHPDAQYADNVVAITDNLVKYPCAPIEISQDFVNYVVTVDSIGDPSGIMTGTMRVTSDPINLRIADMAAELIDTAGYIKDGMSFQAGAGGTSLAVAAAVKKRMADKGVKGSFGAGGITSFFVDMLKEGLFEALLDTQCFDLSAVRSAGENPKHICMSASMYANPCNKGAAVNRLDVMILGATEIDTDFNVNVITGSDGTILSASGGNQDCAAGSKLTVVVTNLIKGRLSILRDRVVTVTTPGETVDVIVTDRGIAINPLRKDLLEKLSDSALPIVTIEELCAEAERLTGKPDDIEFTDRIVAVAEYRDGTVIDVIRQPA